MSSKKFRLVHRIPNSNILIDHWKPVSQEKYFRFMTFLKLDTNDAIRDICESTYTIYTSLFNKWYLITYYQVSEHRIIDLRTNETRNMLDPSTNSSFSVTALDSNYYTGSLMFLFRGSFGNILYTGFFRPNSFEPILCNPDLRSVIQKKELNTVFIDNTYAAEHCEFPARKEVLDRIISCIKEHPNHKVSISGKRLGKEEILLEIAKALDEKICVTEEKFVIFSRLNVQNYFTTDRKKSRIYASDHIINPKQCLRRQAQSGAHIIILLTAFYHCSNKPFATDFNIPNFHVFPYSGHCSHSELKIFLSFLTPREIQPIIKFEDADLPNSIIPKSLYQLCYKPEQFPTSEVTQLYVVNPSDTHYSKERSSLPSTNTEMKHMDDIDEILSSVAHSNISNFGNETVDSVMSLNSLTSCQSTTNISGLNNSLIDDILATSPPLHSKNISSYLETDANFVTSNNFISESSQSSALKNNLVIGAVSNNCYQDNEIMHILNEQNYTMEISTANKFPIRLKSTNEDIVSASSAHFNRNTVEMNISKTINTPPDIHSQYPENEIAENIISSTNNENFSEINFQLHDELSENNDATSSEQEMVNDNVEKLKIRRLNFNIIDYPRSLEKSTKSTLTDLTLATLAELEKKATMTVNSSAIIYPSNEFKNRAINFLSRKPYALFKNDEFYARLSRINLTQNAVCNYAMSSKARKREQCYIEKRADQFDYSHPIYKKMNVD